MLRRPPAHAGRSSKVRAAGIDWNIPIGYFSGLLCSDLSNGKLSMGLDSPPNNDSILTANAMDPIENNGNNGHFHAKDRN